MKKILLISFIGFVIYTGSLNAKTINWTEAHKYIGQNVVIEGVIKYTKNIGIICFLNFSPDFEKYLSLVIFKEYLPSFPYSPEIYYYLKKVSVSGRITEYKGKPQIMLYSSAQIKVIGEYQRLANKQPCECNYPDQLEITSINIGQGDATLIATSSKIMLADAGESFWNSNFDALKIDKTIRQKYGENCHCIDYVLISHFHLDHIGYIYFPEIIDDIPLNENLQPLTIGESPYKPIGFGGLGYLVLEQGYQIGKMIVRDYHNHNPNRLPEDGGSKTFRNWQIILESKEGKNLFNPEIVKLGAAQVDLGKIGDKSVTIDIIASDGATAAFSSGCDPAVFFGGQEYKIRGNHVKDKIPPSENDLCICFVVSYGDFQMFIGGDLSGENCESKYGYRYHDMETCLTKDLYILEKYGNKIEILRANHHGSSHSSNLDFLKMINPLITIFSVGDYNGYGHVDSRILDNSVQYSKKVFLTECGDKIKSKQEADEHKIIIIDNEYPQQLENNEFDDPNIEIFVNKDGKKFIVQGYHYLSKK